jgi:hypothetical protein
LQPFPGHKRSMLNWLCGTVVAYFTTGLMVYPLF